jgi:hypothetical protein
MATFRVGMRVKQVRGQDAGATGTVAGFDVIEHNEVHGCDICIRHDGFGLDDNGELFEAGEILDCQSCEWEPIQPEGHKTVEWSECLWRPENMRESV